MTDLLMPRRKFLTGLMGLVAAPAVVKAASLMPVKVIQPEFQFTEVSMGYAITRLENRIGGGVCLSELRELLLPGLQKMVDDMYTEHPGQWKSVFDKI
jgi:hypothetical protein